MKQNMDNISLILSKTIEILHNQKTKARDRDRDKMCKNYQREEGKKKKKFKIFNRNENSIISHWSQDMSMIDQCEIL